MCLQMQLPNSHCQLNDETTAYRSHPVHNQLQALLLKVRRNRTFRPNVGYFDNDRRKTEQHRDPLVKKEVHAHRKHELRLHMLNALIGMRKGIFQVGSFDKVGLLAILGNLIQ